ncbi:MAG TPA: hypothetical protein VHX88_18155 [Solirubrobacteraceae bacterium]|nr:hypothetical protein [Solirubrobacteraceae bacterium]
MQPTTLALGGQLQVQVDVTAVDPGEDAAILYLSPSPCASHYAGALQLGDTLQNDYVTNLLGSTGSALSGTFTASATLSGDEVDEAGTGSWVCAMLYGAAGGAAYASAPPALTVA